MTKIDTLFLTNMSCKNHHTLWGWTYLYSPYNGVPLSTWAESKVSRKCELMYTFSTISRLDESLGQAAESGELAQIPLTQGLLMHKISNLQPFSDWISFRKRNTICLWEIASCCTCITVCFERVTSFSCEVKATRLIGPPFDTAVVSVQIDHMFTTLQRKVMLCMPAHM